MRMTLPSFPPFGLFEAIESLLNYVSILYYHLPSKKDSRRVGVSPTNFTVPVLTSVYRNLKIVV